MWPYRILAILLRVVGFLDSKENISKYLSSQYVGFEHTWWRSFQKRIMTSKLDIYVFISGLFLSSLNIISMRVLFLVLIWLFWFIDFYLASIKQMKLEWQVSFNKSHKKVALGRVLLTSFVHLIQPILLWTGFDRISSSEF
jgi:hypothetical protein